MAEPANIRPLRLGVNIDHVATLRNARGGSHPAPLRAAHLAADAGADGITAHLREDRRHMRDADIQQLRREIRLPLNLEMAATAEMLDIACALRPHAACLVPERREERTTEGGLDAAGQIAHLTPAVRRLAEAGVRVSLFIAPEPAQIEAAAAIGAPVIELHTGAYANNVPGELQRLREGAALAHRLGLEVHAGHGLDYANAAAVAEIPEIVEFNIGHFLIGEALFIGLADAIRQMRAVMDKARNIGGNGARN